MAGARWLPESRRWLRAKAERAAGAGSAALMNSSSCDCPHLPAPLS
jgi:hypothetical protein